MEHQLTVRLPGKLAGRLDRVARDTRRKRSEVVRLALEEYLGDGSSRASLRPVEKVRDLLGSYESGLPDLGSRHRDHLIERLKRAR